MALPKTLKYLLCYLPFILVGTGLVVFGVFQEDSARIASLIVGVVVLFSGLFAWCTDTDVGCFVVCSCWSNKDRKLKIKKNSKSTGAGIELQNDIFTIHTNKGATSPPTTNASKKTKTVVNNNDDQTTTTGGVGGKDEHYRDSKMIQRDRHNNYGQYSLYQQKDEEGYGNGTIDRSARKPRFPTRAPSLDNYLNGYKPNGIHGRNEMRLTVRNLQKLDKIRQHHQSVDSEPQMYNPPPNPAMNNEAFEIEFSLSIQKRESIKNWITDVHHSRENVNMNPEHEQKQQQQGPQTWIPHQKGYDSNKIQRKPLPREPANDRYSSTASGSAIDIEVHSLPRSFGSDGNKSPTGTLDRIDSPDQSSNQPQFEISGYIVSEDNQERPRQPATILEAVINDQYV